MSYTLSGRLLLAAATLSLTLMVTADPAWAAGCDYYAAPTDASPPGSAANSGELPSAPITVAKFFAGGAGSALAQPGKTLCLLAGVYRGADSMIDFADFDGTQSQPITVRAETDGAVVIHGEYARVPVRVQRSSWIVLEGFDARDSGSNVVSIAGDQQVVDGQGNVTSPRNPSTDIVMRRVAAWNANPGWADGDEDGVHDALDNCPGTENPAFETPSNGFVQPNDDLAEEASGAVYGNACDCDFNNDGSCNISDALFILNDYCVFHPLETSPIDCTTASYTRYDESTDMDGDGDVDGDDGVLYGVAAADTLPGPAAADDSGETGANFMVIGIAHSDRITLEDVAAFGTGRKMIQVYRSVDVTVQRAWARWEGHGTRNNRAVSCSYRSYGSRCENLLVTASGLQLLGPGPAPGMLIGTDALAGEADAHYAPGENFDVVDLTQIGSLAYVDQEMECVENHEDHTPGRQWCPDKGFYSNGMGRKQSYADGVVYFDPSILATSEAPREAARLGTIECGELGEPCDAEEVEATVSNITYWNVENPPEAIKFGWIEESIEGPESSEVGRVFAAESGNGGQLCLRADGTGKPLWPWPMRDRVLAATTNQERYPTPESLEPGAWTPQPVDIHETIEGMFGAIPPSCWDSDGDGVPDSEDNCSELANPDQLNDDLAAEQTAGTGIFGNLCDCDFNNDGNCNVNDTLIHMNDYCVFFPEMTWPWNCTTGTHTRYSDATDMDGDDDVDQADGALYSQAAADQLPGPGAVSNP